MWIVGVSEPKPPRFAPEEKTFSCEEASTTTRTASSSRALRSESISSPSRSGESELRVSGSSSVIVATPVAATS